MTTRLKLVNDDLLKARREHIVIPQFIETVKDKSINIGTSAIEYAADASNKASEKVINYASDVIKTVSTDASKHSEWIFYNKYVQYIIFTISICIFIYIFTYLIEKFKNSAYYKKITEPYIQQYNDEYINQYYDPYLSSF